MIRDASQQARYDQLVALFRDLGGYDPEGWAATEVDKNVPVLASFLFLRRVWRDFLDPLRSREAFLEKQNVG